MTINQIVTYILAFGAALGGIDKLLGNRWGYGEKFEKGFHMLGPVAISMAGIISLAPIMSMVVDWMIGPVWDFLHLDPAIFGGMLAIDMGGAQLAVDLAKDPQFGLFCAVILTTVFGCTLVYIIPVGIGFMKIEDRPFFTRGVLLGLVAMPFYLISGCMALKMDLMYMLVNCIPIFLLSIALGIGVIKKPEAMIRGLLAFAKFIRSLAILGLMLGAVSHLTGLNLLPGMIPLPEAMETVVVICITMLGSFPLAELIQRVMKTPFRIINEKMNINAAGTTSLLICFFSATPALAAIPQMNRRAQVVISAIFVTTTNIFGAHFAYANQHHPDMVPAMIVSKVVGGIVAAALSLYATRDMKD